MNGSQMRQHFQRALAVAGKRWRNRFALRGLFAVIAGLTLASALAIAFMDASHFAPATVGTARVFVYLLLIALLLVFIVARVPRSRDRQGLVEHLELHTHRQTQGRTQSRDTLLLTALQMDAADADAALDQRLYERAAAAVDDPRGSTREDRSGLRRAAGALLGLGCVLAIALFMLGDGARHGVKLLLAPWRDAQQGMPYRIVVQPGDTAVRERTDVVINGATQGFVPQKLTLVYRGEGESRWSRTPMQAALPGAEQASGAHAASRAVSGGFSADLLAVAAPFEYYLEGDNVRSPTHRVAVRWLPRAERVDHIYHYPRYTGIADRLVQSATDIAAVSGSIVDVRVLPHVAADEGTPRAEVRGELVLDDSTRRALVRDGEMLGASLRVDEASRYRIELRADPQLHGDGELVPVTPDHGIKAYADGAPVVKVARPGSDTQVTAVEEIAVQIQADDDVSLRQVELVYSINGDAEEVVALVPAAVPTAAPSVTATHTLYLEQYKLKPGDVISYHARASDGVVSRTAVTDIQFMEVRPFDRDYRRGRSGGGGGGGGGQRNEESLAAQQRDLVVALFRLARDSQQLPAEEQAQRLTTLSDAQHRIRERVAAIVRRIEGRAVVQDTPGYIVMLEVMPKAIAAMARVEALLAVPDADQSLPSAREALAHLQRADAAFREVQVASQQGGGGGGRASNNDLSRLFELEMDRFRNRYSQVQRAQAPQRQRQVDETLDKLKELARRQGEEVERARRRAERARGSAAHANEGSRGSSAGGAATQQALAQALDELLRQLERLSREQPSAAMDAARQQMQQAAQSMRQSMQPPPTSQSAARSSAQGGKSQGREQGNQQGGAQSNGTGGGQQGADAARPRGEQAAREALQRLDAARKALAGDGGDQVSREMQQAQQRVQSLVRRQAQIEQRLRAGEDPRPREQRQRFASDEQAARLAQLQSEAANRKPTVAGEPDDQRVPHDRADGSNDVRDSARAADDSGNGDGDRERSIDELKARMQTDAQQLREQLDRIASAKDTAAPVRGPARRAGEVMREEDVEGRVRFSREQLAAGQSYGTLESSIAEALERVREQVAQAAAAAAQGGEQRAGQRADERESQGRGQGGNPGSGQRAGQGWGPGGGDASMPSAERLREMMRELAGLRDRFGRGEHSGAAGPGGRSRDDLRALASDLGRFGSGSLGPVASNFDSAGDLRTLIEGIEALAAQGAGEGGTHDTQASDALLAALARVERLVKAHSEAGQSTVPTGRDARTPRQYRALVEAYYRRLSETR